MFLNNFINKGSEMAVENCAVFDVIDEKINTKPTSVGNKA